MHELAKAAVLICCKPEPITSKNTMGKKKKKKQNPHTAKQNEWSRHESSHVLLYAAAG